MYKVQYCIFFYKNVFESAEGKTSRRPAWLSRVPPHPHSTINKVLNLTFFTAVTVTAHS